MRWLTFRDGDSERAGVLSGDAEMIHSLPPGVSLLDLIGHGAAGLREAGQEARGRRQHRPGGDGIAGDASGVVR